MKSLYKLLSTGTSTINVIIPPSMIHSCLSSIQVEFQIPRRKNSVDSRSPSLRRTSNKNTSVITQTDHPHKYIKLTKSPPSPIPCHDPISFQSRNPIHNHPRTITQSKIEHKLTNLTKKKKKRNSSSSERKIKLFSQHIFSPSIPEWKMPKPNQTV